MITAGIVTFRTDLDMLGEALASLATCTFPVETIIVDNTPEPEYFAALQTRIKDFPRVRCLKSGANKGYGFGQNLALAMSPASTYHLVMNPDVILHPGCLEALVEAMEHEPAIGLAVPKALNRDGSLQPLNKRDPTVLDLALRRLLPGRFHGWPPIRRRLEHYTMMDIGYDRRCEVPFASGCCMLFRRGLLARIGGFDERFFLYFEDADISRRTRANARIVYLPEAIITHGWARGSKSSWRLKLALLASAWRYFHTWGWRWK